MKKVIILQNSDLSFGLDASKLVNTKKYQLYLFINKFSFDILTQQNQEKYYTEIFITDDFSFHNISTKITSLLQGYNDFNVVTNSEETMPICGEIRQFFGLDSEDYSRFYDKHIMKKRLSKLDHINLPKYELFDHIKFTSRGELYLKNLISKMSFPLFIKPTCMYGALQTAKINSYEELRQWAESVKVDTQYEIDEFIDGTMYHCDSYIKNGKVLFTFVSQNSRPCYDFTIGKMKGTIVLPKEHPDSILLSNIAEKTLNALGIPKGGVTHLEVIKTKENKIYFIEMAHRSPGCLIPKMYSVHAGVDTISSHILLQIDPNFSPKPNRKIFSAWACYPKIPGIVAQLDTLPNHIKSKYEINWNIKVGDVIKTYSLMGRDYTGTIFMTNHLFEELYQEFMEINNLNLCEIT